jgi:hypothetical protein
MTTTLEALARELIEELQLQLLNQQQQEPPSLQRKKTRKTRGWGQPRGQQQQRKYKNKTSAS